ncbi:AAA family ATPase [Fibrobacter sp.]|uniref:AAA family ATPase n=1 Tax=Fibrobacter sp. TaxID=35828 RepID=UPI0025BB4B38|nr:AAA family ATPase [Fibrobacter sp.]MBR4006704.1 AAA family ATPase [Fibrobacter sp.]
MTLREEYKTWLPKHDVQTMSYLGNPIKDLLDSYEEHHDFKQIKQDITNVDRTLLNKDQKSWLNKFSDFINEKIYGSTDSSHFRPVRQNSLETNTTGTIQIIFFGAPGTGKSYKVNSILAEQRKNSFASSDTAKSMHYAEVLSDKNYVDCNIWIIDDYGILEKKLVTFESDDKVSNPRHSALRAYIEFIKKNKDEYRENRVTFHPDYDYAQFVGAYKPKKGSDGITYSFVPQVFAKAYAAAWKQYVAAGNASTANNQVYLVIEEINRGNCAQIFGDIFQLLDRDSEGFSQYAIDADCDFATWLKEDSILKTVWNDYETKVGDGKLKLPPNLNILATMNTSDQSLFPMDSAFKRRFDWEYVPISFDGKDAANYLIDIDGSQCSWQKFVETVNEKILTLTESEDKQLGEFFIKPDNGNVISKNRFLGKVMFYLWNEICKDEHKNGSFFRTKDESGKVNYFTFQDLYRDAGLLKRFMDELLKKDT